MSEKINYRLYRLAREFPLDYEWQKADRNNRLFRSLDHNIALTEWWAEYEPRLPIVLPQYPSKELIFGLYGFPVDPGSFPLSQRLNDLLWHRGKSEAAFQIQALKRWDLSLKGLYITLVKERRAELSEVRSAVIATMISHADRYELAKYNEGWEDTCVDE